ncbi:hypothetical protein N9V90_01140 [Endozoicomonas sp.]|nr:hypothetical protein [Endozoicomonas sp.]
MENIITMSKPKRLIRTLEEVDQESLDDIIYIAARNVEDALITGGAVPGKDYNILDCYKLAKPYALHLFEHKNAKFTISSATDE